MNDRYDVMVVVLLDLLSTIKGWVVEYIYMVEK